MMIKYIMIVMMIQCIMIVTMIKCIMIFDDDPMHHDFYYDPMHHICDDDQNRLYSSLAVSLTTPFINSLPFFSNSPFRGVVLTNFPFRGLPSKMLIGINNSRTGLTTDHVALQVQLLSTLLLTNSSYHQLGKKDLRKLLDLYRSTISL